MNIVIKWLIILLQSQLIVAHFNVQWDKSYQMHYEQYSDFQCRVLTPIWVDVLILLDLKYR